MYLYFYIVCLVLFALRSLLSLESNIVDLNQTRSRESKVLLRRKVARDKRDILLAVVWPWVLCRALHCVLMFIKASRDG